MPSYLVYGRVSLETGKHIQALDLLTRYDPYDPQKTWVFYYSLGKAVYLTGNEVNDALELLDKAVSMGGEGVDLYRTRAQIYADSGQFDKAVDDAFTARNFDKNDFDVTLFLGKVLFENQQFSLSLVYLDIASDLTQAEKDLAQVYYWRALAHEEIGNYDELIKIGAT